MKTQQQNKCTHPIHTRNRAQQQRNNSPGEIINSHADIYTQNNTEYEGEEGHQYPFKKKRKHKQQQH